MSNIWACPLGIVPIYYGLDTDIQERKLVLRLTLLGPMDI